jgi:hypothetical protein
MRTSGECASVGDFPGGSRANAIHGDRRHGDGISINGHEFDRVGLSIFVDANYRSEVTRYEPSPGRSRVSTTRSCPFIAALVVQDAPLSGERQTCQHSASKPFAPRAVCRRAPQAAAQDPGSTMDCRCVHEFHGRRSVGKQGVSQHVGMTIREAVRDNEPTLVAAIFVRGRQQISSYL